MNKLLQTIEEMIHDEIEARGAVIKAMLLSGAYTDKLLGEAISHMLLCDQMPSRFGTVINTFSCGDNVLVEKILDEISSQIKWTEIAKDLREEHEAQLQDAS
jgi:hypothetical protein